MIRRISSLSIDSIAKISIEDLRPGSLYEIFRNGKKAVILENDSRVLQLWNDLFDANDSVGTENGEIHPWDGSLVDMARNNQSGDPNNKSAFPRDNAGDTMFFIKGSLAYIARKIVLFKDENSQILRTYPESFINENTQFFLPEHIRQTTWKLGADIFNSALPTEAELPSYCMLIERLKYKDCLADLDKIFGLLDGSGGRWGKFGRKLDSCIATAAGPFSYRFVNILYALASQVPGISKILYKQNEYFRRLSKMKYVDEDSMIIGAPHTDGRLFTCLSSLRKSIKTEIFDGKQWIELPLTNHSLAIFPGRGLENLCGIKPTIHRILQLNQNIKSNPAATNRSLIFGFRPKEWLDQKTFID
jgi:hypothetical protein